MSNTNERAKLIYWLRERSMWDGMIRLIDAANMLEADAKAQQVAPYDQQALELCDECGWKAIMPGEPCFVCNMKTEAQQVAVPDGYALAMAVLQSSLYQFLDDVERAECDALIAAAQGAKQ